MKSLASLFALIALTGPAVAQQPPPPAAEEPQGAGPRGSSEAAPGEVRFDQVGYAGIGDLAGTSAAVAGLAPGSFAEITALDSGRTILVAVAGTAPEPGRVATLSRAAAAALGTGSDSIGIRIRRVAPTPQDAAALGGGQGASARADAPAVLLTALRRKLGSSPSAPAPPVAAKAAPPRKPAAPTHVTARVAPPATAAARSGYYVRVAALSDIGRARALAAAVGGFVEPLGRLFRVQIGPFPDLAAANRGKTAAARRGYGGGTIVRIATQR